MVCHQISLAIKYPIAINIFIVAKRKPIIVAIRKPIFVYDVKLNMAASYKLYQLLCVFPERLMFCL